LTAPPFDEDEVGCFEYAQMLHHSATVQVVEVIAEFACRFRVFPEQVEYLAPATIAQGLEDGFLAVIRA
jgi:hypothetical protein